MLTVYAVILGQFMFAKILYDDVNTAEPSFDVPDLKILLHLMFAFKIPSQ
jgi:hypothetical protein